MKTSLLSHVRPALVSTGIFAVVCCGLYPLAVTGFSKAIFPEKAEGSLLKDRSGTVRGSELIGQNFAGDRYFHSRPSAVGHDASTSGGSNLGPTSEKLAEQIRERLAIYRAENRLAESELVPADAVTASGSGLDPHISPRNAELQAARVAEARGLALEKVRAMTREATEQPGFGFLGDARVNVIKLNLALDSLE